MEELVNLALTGGSLGAEVSPRSRNRGQILSPLTPFRSSIQNSLVSRGTRLGAPPPVHHAESHSVIN